MNRDSITVDIPFGYEFDRVEVVDNTWCHPNKVSAVVVHLKKDATTLGMEAAQKAVDELDLDFSKED